MTDLLSETIMENDEYEEESDYDTREDENDEYSSSSSNGHDGSYYDYDDYDDYLPSDRHWSEDDSDRNSDYEDEHRSENGSNASRCLENVPASEPIDATEELKVLYTLQCEKWVIVKDKIHTLASSLTCIVCLLNKIQILTTPCGHVVMCGDCSVNIQLSGSSNSEKCPLCRTNIENKIVARLP